MGIKLKSLILAAALASSAMGQPVTLTMDPTTGEVPVSGDPTNPTCQPSSCPIEANVGGVGRQLVVSKGGISFTFSTPNNVDFGALRYNVITNALASEVYVQDPVINGQSSTFAIAFSVPVSSIQFGFEVNTKLIAGTTMANVTLFNNGTQVGPAIPIVPDPSVAPPDLASENRFTYSGALGPVTNILITPTNSGFTALSFDNLIVTAAPGGGAVGAVPAASPLTLAITAICLAGLTMLLLRKQAG